MSTPKSKSLPLNNMAQCFEAWANWNVKGAAILSSIDIDLPNSTSTLSDLKEIVSEMRLVLEAMHKHFDQVSEDSQQYSLYRQCIHMFEQEFMVKESIQSIVRESGFMSKQHLTGSISLWKAEAYLDDDVIKQLR